ncbi:MAG: cupin domain-containing protein [Lautropia sp.]
MSQSALKPLRRVVTGEDERGRSRILIDGPAPAAHESSLGSGRSHVDLWVWTASPLPLLRTDDSLIPYDFPGPPVGGHWRVVQWTGHTGPYDASQDSTAEPLFAPVEHELGRRWDRGGKNQFTGALHKTETVDYALLLEGEMTLVLDDRELTLQPGDTVIDVAAWHQWSNRNRAGRGIVFSFDMIAARFVDGSAGLVQGLDEPIRPDPAAQLPAGVRAARRVVIADREPGRSTLVSDGPSPDVRIDPARPGFAIQRMWVTDGSPAKVVTETLHLPHRLMPPPGGSVFNIVTHPSDAAWWGKAGAAEVKAYFSAMDAPEACAFAPQAKHPYMQRTRTIDFVIVIEGEIVLVLDEQEVILKAGDYVVQRATRHAWSNRSDRPAVLAIASHDAA